MATEGDYYFVNLDQEAGIEEVLPFLYRLIINGRQGILASPSGLSSVHNARCYEDDDIEEDDINDMIREYIIDTSQSNHLSLIIASLSFMLCNSQNHSKKNPYSPGEIQLLEQFSELFSDNFIQELMRKLWEYEERELLRIELQRKAKTTIEVRILGQLASGKTTFLNTVLRELALSRANLRKRGSEPEEIEDYYPEMEVVNHYMASRYDLRSGATLGSESLQMYGVDKDNKKIVQVEVHSAGGHFHAERPPSYHHFGATAFFIDYELVQELQTLDESTDIKRVLSNGETVLQSVISLLSRLCEWEEVNGPKLAVVSKLPKEIELNEDVLQLIDVAYERVIQYAKIHLHELNEEIIYFGKEITFPKDTKVSTSTTNWKHIENDTPEFTGTMDVLHTLVSLASRDMQVALLTFDEQTEQPNTVYYKQVV